ncbi:MULTISPECIES: glycosyltransferase family 4 protein [Cupriavidus]
MNSKKTPIKLYVDTPYWYARPKNTDWRYTFAVKGMSSYEPFLVNYSREFRLVFEENFHWIERRLLKKNNQPLERVLSLSAISWCNPDILYSHGRFPVTTENVPAAWLHGVVDPDMRIRSGVSVSSIEYEYKRMRPIFERAGVVLCPTRAFAMRHSEKFPDISNKFQYSPFFLSNIEAITEDVCIKKHMDDGRIRFLFVGRDAYRKGLDLIFSALNKIPESVRKKIAMDVVTNDRAARRQFGHIEGITWHQELSKMEVVDLMRRAHVFVMPSRFETYGLVYLEAMASGCAVISANWESQREIFDGGECGFPTDSNVNAIAAAIRNCCCTEIRIEKSLNGIRKFSREYSPASVSARHYDVFSSII